jgi:peptide/nickel transport system substrate-binding protein
MRVPTFLALLALVLVLPAAALAAPSSEGPQGTVTIAQGVDPTTLDPMNHQETPAGNLASNMFDTLLERDGNLALQPALAADLPKLVAPTVWEFKLRPGVKFHNGEPLDAEAVKFSLERLIDPKLKLRGATPYAPISHVEVMDSLTVRVHTKVPWPILDTAMSASGASILPPKYYRDKDLTHVARNPVGSGPFKFVRWVKDDRIELEANEGYWRGAPRVKRLVWRPIPDDAVRVAALQNGEVDVAVNIPPHLANIIANHPKLFLSTAPSVRTIQLLYYTHQFDVQHKLVGPYPGPVADRRVRLAMNHAVDVDEVIRTVLDGKAIRVASMLTDKHFGFESKLLPVKPDLARVKQLLTEAGYPGGVDMVLNAPQGRYVRDKEVAEGIAGQLSKAGIRITLRVHEWGNYLNSMAYVHKAGPVWLIGWGTSAYDAETVYVPLFRSGKILANYHNADFDGMVDQAQTVMDPKRRAELYHRITRLWIDDAAAMPLYQQLDLYGATRRMSWKARGDEQIKGFDMALKDAR